ncbi:hypothetical protein EGW08_009112 [Elysia chlorotica]|uniref:C2 domain-containing protein n=1 Tax=Elysia chlorotica TaxID=188477 RepID=A0A433TNG1_ELYCH|nr:hypothetical protein EGW08_009112 [Elysia chlorotica]
MSDVAPAPAITLGVVCAVGLLVIVMAVGMLLWLRARRRRQKLLHDLTFDDGLDQSKSTKSAPTSRSKPRRRRSHHISSLMSGLNRSPSPKQDKRMSWTEPTWTKKSARGMLVRSLTTDRIPEFTLPPERVQPRSISVEGEKGQQFTYSPPHRDFNHGTVKSDLYTAQTTPPAEKDVSGSDASSRGRLWYSVLYDLELEQLAVTLVKVKDLPGRSPNNSPRDPFVKMFLLPDERTCRVSKVKRKTLNPVYNETVSFLVPKADVTKRVLRFSVYDVDKRRVRHSLGHVMANLKDMDLSKGDTKSADLETTVQPVSANGDLQVSLLYLNQHDKIKVGLHKARNLTHMADYPNHMAAYMRIQLMYGHKCHRMKRTLAVVAGTEITFNESLSFTVQGRQFDSCNIIISLMLTFPGLPKPAGSRPPSWPGSNGAAGSTSADGDVEYGRVILGPFMYARGEELAHWQQMLAHPKAVSTKWHAFTNGAAQSSSP